MSYENRSVKNNHNKTKKPSGFFVYIYAIFYYIRFFEKFENGMRRFQYLKEREKITHEWNQI